MSSDIIFERLEHSSGDIGLIRLNRLDNLNALTHPMVLDLFNQLSEWKTDPKIKAVVIKSEHEKAFCAGGDIRSIYDKGKAADPDVTQFFYDEYRLNYLIHYYPKPYIAIMNGINMGGGVGISLHGSHKVAVDDLILAMPETGIGLFPDIGGGYLLSHCPEPFGMYLALTGDKIGAQDAMTLEWVDKVITKDGVGNLIQQLVETELKHDPKSTVSHIIRSVGCQPPEGALKPKADLIEDCFNEDSVEAIMQKLASSNHELSDSILKQMRRKSPTSMKVTFKQIQSSVEKSLPFCLKMEYRMVSRFMAGHDFFEGVRALIVDKDKSPKWSPDTLEAVTEEMVNAYFLPLDRELELEDLL